MGCDNYRNFRLLKGCLFDFAKEEGEAKLNCRNPIYVYREGAESKPVGFLFEINGEGNTARQLLFFLMRYS